MQKKQYMKRKLEEIKEKQKEKERVDEDEDD